MAQVPKKFYTIEETSALLGVPPAEVNAMRERNELHAYRDGANWKFKVEEVDPLAKELRAKRKPAAQPAPPAGEPEDDGGDVLLSEFALGASESGTSGTVIGHGVLGAGGSGLGGDPVADSDLQLAGGPQPDLDLTLEEDLAAEESGKGKGGADEMVVGASGSGSDITIGGDSGISLVDPADSGLSLEEPLELGGGGAGEESLELGEDDMLTFQEGTDTESPTELKADDEFLLTPLEEGGEEESASQVIALDSEPAGAAPGRAAGAGMMAMLDEDMGGEAGLGMGLAPAGAPLGEPVALGAAAAALPEAPYSPLVIFGLVLCVLFLSVSGMMVYELVRNVHSWSGASATSTALMDALVDLIGK